MEWDTHGRNKKKRRKITRTGVQDKPKRGENMYGMSNHEMGRYHLISSYFGGLKSRLEVR